MSNTRDHKAIVYRFDDYSFNLQTHELFYKNTPQKKLKPLIFKLLQFMLENPQRVLTREELIREVWDARYLSDSALSAAISATRTAIGDSGKQQKYIKTVSGSGYRFVVDIDCVTSNEPLMALSKELQPFPVIIHKASQKQSYQQLVNAAKQAPAPLSLPDQPSIAVMDFIALKNSPEQQLSAYGLTMEINAGLARLSQLFVIARASSEHLSSINLLPAQIGQQLGVRYLLYGHTKTVNRRIEVILSLVDASSSEEIWSEDFNVIQDDILAIQNDMIAEIVTAIDYRIEQAEVARSFLIPTENLSAWEHYYRGLWHMNQTSIEGCNTAQHHFQKALTQDERFSRAYAGLSYTYSSRVLLDDTPSKNNTYLKKSSNYAKKGILYNTRDPMSFFSLGRSFWIAGDHEQCIVECDRGLSLEARNVMGLNIKVINTGLTSRDKQTYQLMTLSSRISPFDPMIFSNHTIYAISLIHQEKYEEAVIFILRAISDPHAFYLVSAIASACHELAGYSTQAKEYAAKTLKQYPQFTISTYQRLASHRKKQPINELQRQCIKLVYQYNK